MHPKHVLTFTNRPLIFRFHSKINQYNFVSISENNRNLFRIFFLLNFQIQGDVFRASYSFCHRLSRAVLAFLKTATLRSVMTKISLMMRRWWSRRFEFFVCFVLHSHCSPSFSLPLSPLYILGYAKQYQFDFALRTLIKSWIGLGLGLLVDQKANNRNCVLLRLPHMREERTRRLLALIIIYWSCTAPSHSSDRTTVHHLRNSVLSSSFGWVSLSYDDGY